VSFAGQCGTKLVPCAHCDKPVRPAGSSRVHVSRVT
jgi:hypothetical protein